MKKLAALLLSAATLLTLCACNVAPEFEEETTVDTSLDVTLPAESEEITLPQEESEPAPQKYYEIEHLGLARARYHIYNDNGDLVLTEETDRPLQITAIDRYILEIRIGMGTGISVCRYYDALNDRFSKEYTYVAAATLNFVAYLEGTSLADRKLVVSDLFDEKVFYKEYSLDFSPNCHTPIQSAEFIAGDCELRLSYLAGAEEQSLDVTLTVRDSLEAYGDVIELYKHAIEHCANHEDSKDAVDRYAEELGIVDAEKKALLGELMSATYLFYPGRTERDSHSPHYKLSCGYAIKDLNRDGVDELICMTEDGHVSAVFSLENGKPKLLATFRERKRCWIDGNGYVHEDGSSGASYSTTSVYRIADGGGSLELIEDFGTDGVKWIGDTAHLQYYKLENGEKVSITKEECSALWDQYGHYLGYEKSAEVTKELAGLTFIPAFTEWVTKEMAVEIAKDYWSNFEIEKNGYIVVPAANNTKYSAIHVIVIKWLVMEHHYSTFDEIWIDATTGKTIIPGSLEDAKKG